MKYSNLRAFEKHLAEAGPVHFSPVYFIIGKDEYERKEAEKILVTALLGEKTSREHALKIFNAERHSIEEVFAELGSRSFFSDKSIIIVHNAENFDKEANAFFEKYFDSPAPATFLVISAEAINRGTKFYKKGEAAGIILDFLEEKPWEKENSLAAKLVDWARHSGKKMNVDAARYLIQFTGTDQSLLQNEMEKLFCYTAEKNSISTPDISAICTGINTETAWQLGDAIFKRDGASAIRIATALVEEGTQFFSFVRQLRSQFQSKLQICSILSQGGGPAEIQEKFPYMKGQILQQNIQMAKSYGMEALKKGIQAIDETELLAKNSSLDIELLTQRLIIKLS
jgi:DNA polymerase-3 subunit delta